MAEWVIAGRAEKTTPPEVGKTYEVRHERKGKFVAKVLGVSGEWANVEILAGVATAVMRYNVRGKGETLTVRDSHTYWIPVKS